MTPQRWQQIKEVAFAALDLEGEKRAAFLENACGTDRDLRENIESLLQQDQKSGGSIERAIAAAAAQVQKGSVAEGAEPMLGRTISHYKIGEKLGQGGMGVVYQAEDTKLRRTVALKFPPIDQLAGEEEKARFVREAQAAAALNHPNICTVYEIDEADGHTFIAMEFVAGQSIKDKAREGPLPVDEALDIAIQAARGLQAAHEQGIVHRDIKGANLMVTGQGQVKVMDFGLAQVGDRSQLTKSGTTLGTPSYMSPEQAQAQPTDRRTDIWSLGVVLYEMLTGQLPFKGDVEAAVAYAVVNTEPEPPTALRSGLPLELDPIVDKALAKDPEQRYQHVEDMLVDLRAVRRSRGSSSTTKGYSGPRPMERRRPKAAALIALALFVAVALLTAGFGLSDGRPSLDWLAGMLGPGLPDEIKLAILPFEAAEEQQIPQELLDGLVEMVTDEMTRAETDRASFVVAPSREVFKHEFADLVTAEGELGANVIVQGTVGQQDEDYSLVLRLRDPADGRVFDSANLSHAINDPTGLQQAVTASLGRNVGD